MHASSRTRRRPAAAPRKDAGDEISRFFRRLTKGRFDEDDLRRYIYDLAAVMEASRFRYGSGAPVALGFSNGVNVATALLLRHPSVLSVAALLRAMVPVRQPPHADLLGTRALLV